MSTRAQRPRHPRLVSKARLRFDRHSGKHLLVYPEKGLALNAAAAEVIELCTGEHELSAIVDQLAARHSLTPRERIERDAQALLDDLAQRGLIEDAS